jgi:hypothetical protein
MKGTFILIGALIMLQQVKLNLSYDLLVSIRVDVG